mgnify:CR=1 FL=1
MVQWTEQKQLAIRVVNNEPDAWLEAMTMVKPSKELTRSDPNQIDYLFSPSGTIIARVKLGHKVLPDKKYSLTKTGKLSQRNMPKKEYYRLYVQLLCKSSNRHFRYDSYSKYFHTYR